MAVRPHRDLAPAPRALLPCNDATARRAPGTYEYARPTGAASHVLWDNSFELISSLVASGTATICVEGAAEGKALRSRLHKSARLDAVAAAPDVYEFQGDADPLGLDRYGLYVGQCIAGGRLAFFVFYTPSAGAAIFGRWGTLDMRALKLCCLQARTNLLRAQAGLPIALPAAQAVLHYRASLAKRPQTHGVDTPKYQAWHEKNPSSADKTSAEYQDWHDTYIKRGAQTKSVNLAQSQHITLKEAPSLVAQHPACPCPTCGHTAFRPESMKVCVPALHTVT
ncbi:hypothetical protein T492DRAFT_1069907 [Pavlovales sp. CCMP2436]|nr:hypothetical protein T492DRAFT_1069907 [Pavlovales sp. CCMP2436]